MQRPSATPRVQRKRGYHHGDLREALVRAALRLAVREGPEGITIRAVAASAGVSSAAAYHHFDDKRALLAAAAGAAFERLDARVALALEGAGSDPLDQVEAFARAYVAFALEDAGSFRLAFGAHVVEQGLDQTGAVEPGRRLKGRGLALARAFADGKTDPQVVFQMLWASMHGWSVLAAEKELGGQAAKAPSTHRAVALAGEAARRLADSFRN